MQDSLYFPCAYSYYDDTLVAKQCREQPACLARHRVGASLLANCVVREQARSYIVNAVMREQARSYIVNAVIREQARSYAQRKSPFVPM